MLAPWKKSYDQPRQHIKKQRHYLFSRWTLIPSWEFLGSSVGKESACRAGDPGSVPGSGRSPVEGNGNPRQYSCLEIPMDRGAWRATVHGVARVGPDLVTTPPLVTIKEPHSSVDRRWFQFTFFVLFLNYTLTLCWNIVDVQCYACFRCNII